MVPQIRLTRVQLADLTALCAADLGDWKTVADRATGLPRNPMLPKALLKTLGEVAPSEFVDALLRQTLSLISVMLRSRLTDNEIFDGLRKALKQAPALWKEDAINRWAEREPFLRVMLNADAVIGTAKALDLSYEHAQLFRRARVLTDIRPVFDRDATTIQGAVISHTLRLRYDDLDGEHSISLALDRGDIQNVLDECQRALKKCDAAFEFVKKTGTPPLVPGSDA